MYSFFFKQMLSSINFTFRFLLLSSRFYCCDLWIWSVAFFFLLFSIVGNTSGRAIIYIAGNTGIIFEFHFITSFCYYWCRALVEVKPLLYVPEDINVTIGTEQELSCARMPSYWGFQHAHWHDSCIQKCVVHGKICAVVLCITRELLVKICSESLVGDQVKGSHQNSLREAQMERLSRFCIYLLDKLYMQNNFSWEDTKVSFLCQHLNLPVLVGPWILITFDMHFLIKSSFSLWN